MANYIINASLSIKNFCDDLINNEKVKNLENSKMVNKEQEQLIKTIRLKLDAMEKHL